MARKCATDCAKEDEAEKQRRLQHDMNVGGVFWTPRWTRPSMTPDSGWPNNWQSSMRTCVGVPDQLCFDCGGDVEQQSLLRCEGCGGTM